MKGLKVRRLGTEFSSLVIQESWVGHHVEVGEGGLDLPDFLGVPPGGEGGEV